MHLSICTTLLIALVIIALLTPTVSSFPTSTNNVCDVNTPVGTHKSAATGAATRLLLSTPSVSPGGSLLVTLSGTIRGFVLYAASAAGVHKGVLTNNANSAACETSPAGSDTGSTIRHKIGGTKLNQQFNWKAPTQPGVYTFYALVTEAAGASTVYRLPTTSVTVTAPAMVTQPPPMITQPPIIITQPPVATQRPVITQPPPVTTVSPPIIIEPPTDSTDPPVVVPDTPIFPTTQQPPVTTTAPPSTGTGTVGIITPSKGATRPFDAATVALHATPNTDCWTSLNNVVYDISGLYGRHPGGDSTLSGYCGADASDIFTSVHSTAAADLAKMEATYRIGVLAIISDAPVTTQAPVVGPGKGQGGMITPAAQGGGATSTTTKSGMSDSVYIGIIVGSLVVLGILIGGFIYWQKSKLQSTSIAPRV